MYKLVPNDTIHDKRSGLCSVGLFRKGVYMAAFSHFTAAIYGLNPII